MSLNCGLVGLPGCGKTTIYNAITAAGTANYGASEQEQSVVNVPDPRIEGLVEIYKPKKIVPATLEIVDIPGIKAGSTAGEGRGTKLLGHIKDVEALLHVVRCFEGETGPGAADPVGDVETIDLEMMVADSQTLFKKIERLAKKAKAGDKEAMQEVEDCEKVRSGLDEGLPARQQKLSERERASVRECNLLSLKPVLYIANVQSLPDAESEGCKALQDLAQAESSEIITLCGKEEAEISQLEPADQEEFLKELGLQESSRERLLRAAYKLLGLVSFFTAGPKEVHAWTCRRGDTAPVAAGNIHTDMEKGFIRMEVLRYEDLKEYGSEAAVAKAGKQRLEGKTYEVQDGDIVVVRFNPN